MNTKAQPSAGLVVAAFAAIYLIWGSTYLAILIGLKTMPPFVMSGIRFSIAGAILILWRLARGEKATARPTLQNALAGVFMLF